MASSTTATTTGTTTINMAAATCSIPQRPRPRRKVKSDPFFDLPPAPSRVLSPSEQPHVSPYDAISSPAESYEPFLYRIIMTPILFTSFLLSLFLVNRSDLARRATASSSSPTAAATTSASTAAATSSYFSPRVWLSPEPYQESRRKSSPFSSQRRSSGKDVPQASGPRRSQGWFYRKKHRAMARLAIGDAFELRKRVIVAMLIVMALCSWGFFWALNKLYARWFA